MRVDSRSTAGVAALLFVFVIEACGAAPAAQSPMSVQAAPGKEEEILRRAPGAQARSGDNDSDGIPDSADVASAYPQQPTADNTPPPAPPPPPPGSGGGRPKPSPIASDAPHDAAMLIYTANLTMAVYQVESALSAVEQIGRDVGGYLANRTDREIVLRVPRGRFEEAIKKIEATGDVIHRDIQAQDVTDEFLDTEIRLKNARAMRDRLQQLLDKAAVKEALEIEKELGRVTQEIERMEGRLKVLRDKIAYSTITVTFDARAASLHTMPLRLPFAWLNELGLPHLLRLNEGK